MLFSFTASILTTMKILCHWQKGDQIYPRIRTLRFTRQYEKFPSPLVLISYEIVRCIQTFLNVLLQIFGLLTFSCCAASSSLLSSTARPNYFFLLHRSGPSNAIWVIKIIYVAAICEILRIFRRFGAHQSQVWKPRNLYIPVSAVRCSLQSGRNTQGNRPDVKVSMHRHGVEPLLRNFFK